MISHSGERWHCVDPGCRRQAVIDVRVGTAGTNLRCLCGGVMKREYAPPVFRYLDFLRLEEPAFAERTAHEE